MAASLLHKAEGVLDFENKFVGSWASLNIKASDIISTHFSPMSLYD